MGATVNVKIPGVGGSGALGEASHDHGHVVLAAVPVGLLDQGPAGRLRVKPVRYDGGPDVEELLTALTEQAPRRAN